MILKLIIAEDEPNVREGLLNAVDWQAMGVEIVGAAEDGVSAAKLIGATNPDVVLTDIKMPGKDGIELAGWIKENFPKTAVIYLTGYSDFEYARKAISLDVAHYLLKPLEEDELIGALDKIRRNIAEDIDKQQKYDEMMDMLSHKLPAPETKPEPEPESKPEPEPETKPEPEPETKPEPERESKPGSEVLRRSKRYGKVAAGLLEYIYANYSRDIDLKTAAAHLYMNPNYSSRVFSAELGVSFTEYLTEYRMRIARDMLKNGDESIQMISAAVGYGNQKYFGRLFKKREGVNPLEYRKRHGYTQGLPD